MPPASSEEIAMSSEDGGSSLLSLPASPDGDDVSLPSPVSVSSFSSADSYKWPSEESDCSTAKMLIGKGRKRERAWRSADEVALLEAIATHKEKYGRRPEYDDLAAGLRGRLDVDAEEVAKRVLILRNRYYGTKKTLARGGVPVTDDDLKILRLSRRIRNAPKRRRGSPPPASARHERREFAELAGLYPNLASEVEAIDARSGTDGMLKMAFGFIGDEKAAELEAKIKEQNVREVKISIKQCDLKTKVARALLEFLED